MNFDRAFRVGGVSLGDQVGVSGGSLDPALEEDGTIPIGSLYLRAEDTVFQKWSAENNWVELSRWPFLFATSRASALDYVPTSVADKTLSYRMPVAGVVVGVFCQAEAVTKGNIGVELWLDGQPHVPSTITLLESATPVYGSHLDLSAIVVPGKPLQIRMTNATGVAEDLIVTVLFARRSG